MPLVHVYQSHPLVGGVDAPIISRVIRQVLPGAVAQYLSGREKASRLTNNDIEIKLLPIDPDSDLFNDTDLAVVVWAHDFKSRRANVDFRASQIVKAMRDSLQEVDSRRMFVWIILSPTGFSKSWFGKVRAEPGHE